MIFLITKNKKKLNLLYNCSSIYKIIPLSTQRKGWSSKRKRVLCWSIYIISLCCKLLGRVPSVLAALVSRENLESRLETPPPDRFRLFLPGELTYAGGHPRTI